MTTMVQDELLFSREAFASSISWLKYQNGHKLKPYDFIDKVDYTKYFLISLELNNWGVVIIDAPKGGGKSLFGTWLSYWNKKLFGKSATINFRPKNDPQMTDDENERYHFGNYNFINQQIFVDEWVKLTELAEREDANEIINNISELTKFSIFYNSTIFFDEAKKWVWKRIPNARLLRFVAELVDVARHNHNVMLFACPDAEKIVDETTILEGRTHIVHCSFNTTYPKHATYSIQHRYSGRVEWLHLSAPAHSHLWESENLIGMSKPITKKQMDDAYKRLELNKTLGVK